MCRSVGVFDDHLGSGVVVLFSGESECSHGL